MPLLPAVEDGGKMARKERVKRGSQAAAWRLWCSEQSEGEVFLERHEIVPCLGLRTKQRIDVLVADQLRYAERDIYVLEVPDIEVFLARYVQDESIPFDTMQLAGRDIRFAWIQFDVPVSQGDDAASAEGRPAPLGQVTQLEPAREEGPFDSVGSDDTEKIDFGGTVLHGDLFVIERSSDAGAEWDGSLFISGAARAAGVMSRVQTIPKHISVFDVAGRYLIEQLDRVSPDLRRASQAGAFLAEIHTHAGELLLKEFSLHEELDWLQRELEISPFFRASLGEAELRERTQSAVAALNEAHQTLGTAHERIKQALEFTKTSTEAAGLHADLALNRAMLFLTIVTVAAGILPMMDKYQSDRTFGIDATTALQRIMIGAVALLLFTFFSLREHILRWGASIGPVYGLADRVLSRSYAAWQFFGLSSVAKHAAWAMSSEHLQRIHMFHVPMLRSKVLDASGDEAHTAQCAVRLERTEDALLGSLESVAVSVTWLSAAADDSEESQTGMSAQGRMVAARDETRFLLRWCSLILEPNRSLPPAEEVGYWLVVKAATLELTDRFLNARAKQFESFVFEHNYAPWTDSRSLALRVGEDFLFDAEQVAQLKVRLDRAAKRVLDKYGAATVPVDGALERLFATESDAEESTSRERFSLDAWLSAAFEEGLALGDIVTRWDGSAE